jgi:putative phage-type endonuclease
MTNRNNFPAEAWIDKGSYYLSNHQQGTSLWHLCRSFRVTASNSGTVTDLNPYENKFYYALCICKIVKKEFNDLALERMAHGTNTEPIAREFYEKYRGLTVEEVGLAVPKWETRIGASVDGNIIDSSGIIEIKCPKTMYKPLIEKMNKTTSASPDNRFEHAHIASYYYCQMQMNMKVLNKNWCDYIVYAVDSGQCYIERVLFSETFWEQTMWPKIQLFLNEILDPLLNLIFEIAPNFDYLNDTWENYAKKNSLEYVELLLNNSKSWNIPDWHNKIDYIRMKFASKKIN